MVILTDLVRLLWDNFTLVIVLAGVLILVCCTDMLVYVRALPYYLLRQYPYPEHRNLFGNGQVVGYIDHNIGRYIVERDKRLYSSILKQHRNVFVYLPSDFRKDRELAYPAIIILHGLGGNHLGAANVFPPLLDRAIREGNLPPTVMISPDFSLGSITAEQSKTYSDKSLCSCYVNSDMGRFEDYFTQELVPWIQKEFNVSSDPNQVALLGLSMGGFGAFSWGLRYPSISSTLIGIYPSVDLRYSCGGDSQAKFDPARYVPLTMENPKRQVMSIFGGLIKKTEEDVLYPVFKGITSPYSFWPKNLSLWERIRKYNPTDILRDKQYAQLSNTKVYLVAGDQDEYNANSKVLSFIHEAEQHGLKTYPEKPIRKGGHHTPDFVVSQLPEILRWLGQIWKS